jgi:hypothetical protein
MEVVSTTSCIIRERIHDLNGLLLLVALFTAVSMGQMLEWALKKHRTYRKEHGSKYPKRNIMIPFIW